MKFQTKRSFADVMYLLIAGHLVSLPWYVMLNLTLPERDIHDPTQEDILPLEDLCVRARVGGDVGWLHACVPSLLRILSSGAAVLECE